jgi:FkbH-like protein
MFEFDQYRRSRDHSAPSAPESSFSPENNIERISLLTWGEHCTECSAPACYKTCDLYEPRPDTRCRRFHFGLYKNRRFPSFRGYGVEVSFKKWAVFAAEGNTAMQPQSRVLWMERLIELAGPIINAVGPVIARFTKDERWTYPMFGLYRRLARTLHVRNKGNTKPDAFLLEVYNPGPRVRMQISMEFAPEIRKNSLIQIQHRFQTTIELPPGYSRNELDRRLFKSFTDSGLPFMVGIAPEADTSLKLVVLSADFVSYRSRRSALEAKAPIKCLVWDLDNTIWDGVLIENDEVKLRPGVKEILEALDSRGILSSIASKNNHDLAWQRLESFGIAEYFLVPQINWRPKSQSVRAIAQELNIGIDSLAFVDDSPFELEEIAKTVPEVTCISAQNLQEILKEPRFHGNQTEDARNRRRYYREAIVRDEKQAEFGTDYLRFLQYCDIHLEISGYQEPDFDRVAELAQRTNQLNFSGRKYEREQLRKTLQDPALDKYILHCSDRFGSYGLIGFGMARRSPDAIEVQDLMLSCRVQGRFVEQAFFSHLQSHHNQAGARWLRVDFTETKRNQAARQALEAAGFTRSTGDGAFTKELRAEDTAANKIVRLECSAGCGNGNGRTASRI